MDKQTIQKLVNIKSEPVTYVEYAEKSSVWKKLCRFTWTYIASFDMCIMFNVDLKTVLYNLQTPSVTLLLVSLPTKYTPQAGLCQ